MHTMHNTSSYAYIIITMHTSYSTLVCILSIRESILYESSTTTLVVVLERVYSYSTY